MTAISNDHPAAAPNLPLAPAEEATDWGKAPDGKTEREFCAGRAPRATELAEAVRIFGEVMRGFRTLHFVGPCVTVFGSARFAETHPLLRAGPRGRRAARPGRLHGHDRRRARASWKRPIAAPGTSAALGRLQHRAARGAEAEPVPRPLVTFRYFFVRKLMLVKYSYAFIAMPGGFGTLDEVFETATLMQTQKIKNFPLVLMGESFWKPLMGFLRDRFVAQGTVDASDVDRLIVTDSATEAVSRIRDVGMREFGLTYGPKAKRRWFLGER